MLQRDPRTIARHAQSRVASWWQRGPARLRLRRRLVVYSIPITLTLLIAMGKIVSTLLTGNAAISDFANHEIDPLRADVSTLRTMNIIEPGKVSVIVGDLDALEGKLDSAEEEFSKALARIPDSCPVRVNLELIRETQGDVGAREGDIKRAEERFNAALQVISSAPAACFTGNNDIDPDRRRIREDASARLADKIKALHSPQAPAAGPPTAANPPSPDSIPGPPPPAPPPPTAGSNDTAVGSAGQGGDGSEAIRDIGPDRIPMSGDGSAPEHHLGTGGDPLDTLQQTLGDADAAGGGSQDTSGHG